MPCRFAFVLFIVLLARINGVNMQMWKNLLLRTTSDSLRHQLYSNPSDKQLLSETSMVDNNTLLVMGQTGTSPTGTVQITFDSAIVSGKTVKSAEILFTTAIPPDLTVLLPNPFAGVITVLSAYSNRLSIPHDIVMAIEDWPLTVTVKTADENYSLAHIRAVLIVRLDVGRIRRDLPSVVEETDCSPMTSCCLRRQLVNFSEIGWDRWIIAPSGFYTGICGGSCSPVGNDFESEVTDSTNSISYELFDQPGCRASDFSPLKIIYSDVAGNIWTANVEKLIVTGCQCVLESIESPTAQTTKSTTD